jgi:hypothetical protein
MHAAPRLHRRRCGDNLTADRNADGSITINFGGSEDLRNQRPGVAQASAAPGRCSRAD